MQEKIKIYRTSLIAFAIILIIAGIIFMFTSKALLLQSGSKELNAQIGRMQFEVTVDNTTKPEWKDTEISVVLDAATKINEDVNFNKTVLQSTIRIKSVGDIPMNITTDLNLPSIKDDGILYMLLPKDESFPEDKDYKTFIENKIGVANATYSEFKVALNNYNEEQLKGYKWSMVGDVFSEDTKIINLPEKEAFKDINLFFWAEYDQIVKNHPNYNNPKSNDDYLHLDKDFSLKISARQVQDPIFSNIPK